jgi:hypothetical protein
MRRADGRGGDGHHPLVRQQQFGRLQGEVVGSREHRLFQGGLSLGLRRPAGQ